jgi:hypothetical protein
MDKMAVIPSDRRSVPITLKLTAQNTEPDSMVESLVEPVQIVPAK